MCNVFVRVCVCERERWKTHFAETGLDDEKTCNSCMNT